MAVAAAAPGDLGGAAAAMRVFSFRKLGFRVSGISFSPFSFVGILSRAVTPELARIFF
jgi:hypothetical protein